MKARYFFIFAVLSGLVGLAAVILHQQQATSLATQIQNQDNKGLPITTQEQQLSSYASRHMGVTENVFLGGSYDRALQAAQVAANPASNGTIYAEAQAACASHADSIAQANCVQAYVTSHVQPSTNPQAVPKPTKAEYTKSFGAPGWTPDVAGIAFLVMIVAGAMGAYLLAVRRY